MKLTAVVLSIPLLALALYGQSFAAATIHTGTVTVFPSSGPPNPGFLFPLPGAWVYLESGDPFEAWSGDTIILDGVPYQVDFVQSPRELYIAEGYPAMAVAAQYSVDAPPVSRHPGRW